MISLSFDGKREFGIWDNRVSICKQLPDIYQRPFCTRT